MTEERILYLFTRKLSTTFTPEERNELEELLVRHPRMQSSLHMLEQFWNDQEHTETVNVEASLQKVLNQIRTDEPFVPVESSATEKKQFRSSFYRWMAAAVLAGLLVLGGISLVGTDLFLTEASLIEKQNGKGVQSTIELPDGSKIWLNADSKLSYPLAFNEKIREVHLQGEAFFDIRKNPSKPFIIHLSNGTVRVLGTSFNIRAYEDEDRVETSVSTGKVAFIPKSTKTNLTDTVFITPDKKVFYHFRSGRLITKATQSKDDKAWTEGRIIFKSMTLEEIAHQLERTFGKKVVFRSKAPKQYRLTGSFQNNTLEEIMFYLSRTKGFSYQITNNRLLIAEDANQLRDQE